MSDAGLSQEIVGLRFGARRELDDGGKKQHGIDLDEKGVHYARSFTHVKLSPNGEFMLMETGGPSTHH